MGHSILKYKLKYAVLDKEKQTISIYYLQKDVAKLFNVSRKTIYRSLPYENDTFIVFKVVNVP